MNKKYNFACSVSSGRAIGCKDVIGGITKVFLMPFSEGLENILTVTASTYLVTDITSATTVFQFDLRPETSSYTSNFNSDDATGTKFYEQVLELQLQKIDKKDLFFLDEIVQGRVQAFVLDANDNVFLMGTRFGATVTAGNMATGTARGDLTGFTMTLTAREEINYILDDSAGVGTANYPFDGLSSSNVTITLPTYPA